MPGLFGADITALSVVAADDDGYGDASLKFISDTFAFLQHERRFVAFFPLFCSLHVLCGHNGLIILNCLSDDVADSKS